jgi:hypothetical protein
MITTNVHNVEVKPDTRNHKGFFVRDTIYTLMGIDQSGWALICQDNTSCHYVDPDCLQETSDSIDE